MDIAIKVTGLLLFVLALAVFYIVLARHDLKARDYTKTRSDDELR